MTERAKTSFVPFKAMCSRFERDTEDSDVTAFITLMYWGEMIVKVVTLGMAAAIQADKDRSKYRVLHAIVRADGIGDWVAGLSEILKGPTSQHLVQAAREEQKQLTQKLPPGTWQHDAISALDESVTKVGLSVDKVPDKSALLTWFERFAFLRNKTRGHGAQLSQQYSAACPDLLKSITLIVENHALFERPWAYLHRNMSGKYRVTPLSAKVDAFNDLKGHCPYTLSDGVYINWGGFCEVELMESDVDASDFFFANGQFTSGEYELLSYVTNDRRRTPWDRYLTPAEQLPASETHGAGKLDVIGNTFTNIPPTIRSYVERKGLESELFNELISTSRRPIITLSGPGGTGKTSTTLQVLHRLAGDSSSNPYNVIIWLSARDIDLLTEGPRPVRPDVLTKKDLAEELCRLLEPDGFRGKGFDVEQYLSGFLTASPVGPALLVIDNFETVSSPIDVFQSIETFVRPPNKVLITTRIRQFKADYPVEVGGMTDEEATRLIEEFARSLRISELLTGEYVEELVRESEGHPYVIKILLGQVAASRQLAKPERIVANQEMILTALFERSFANLPPAAQRVFLLLCNWRSVVPQIALEAVLLRSQEARIDVQRAVDDLRQMSFIEEIPSDQDREVFVSVPLAAMFFGRRKLATSPWRAAVEADTDLMHAIGAARKEDVRHGVSRPIRRLVKSLAEREARGHVTLSEIQPMLHFIAQRVPETWLDLADWYQEGNARERIGMAKEALRRYLESEHAKKGSSGVWKRLADICRGDGDYVGEIHSLVEMSQLEDVPIHLVSNAANRINGLYVELKWTNSPGLGSEERIILTRKLAEVMEKRSDELDDVDCSRLAWLYMNLGDISSASSTAQRGLRMNARNEHCSNLLRKLSVN